MMEQVIFYCSLYVGAHQELLSSFSTKYFGHSDAFYLKLLIEHSNFVLLITGSAL